MHKYLAFLKFKFLQSLQFRAEILVWIALDLIPFAVMFIVFQTIYADGATYHTYSASDMITYYFLVAIIQGISSTHFEGWRVDEIKNGKIDPYLLRPVSYLSEIIVSDIAGKAFYLLLFTPIYLTFFLITQHFIQFTLPSPGFFNLIIFFTLILFGYFIELSMAIMTVLLGFWFEGSQGLEHFKWIIITLLSGSLIPLQFLPSGLQQVSHFLPFQYMYFIPIQILEGKSTLSITDVSIIIFTIVTFSMMLYLLAKKAIYTYTSSGG